MASRAKSCHFQPIILSTFMQTGREASNGPDKRKCDEGSQAEDRRDDQCAGAPSLDQRAEGKRGTGLPDASGSTQYAEPIAVIFRPEDRERNGAARNREDAVSGTMQQCERHREPAAATEQ